MSCGYAILRNQLNTTIDFGCDSTTGMTGIEAVPQGQASVSVFFLASEGVRRMRFVKALNNNAGIATSDAGEDVVIFGKGLAFALKPGQEVPRERVERAFYQRDASMLQRLLADIPQEYFDLSCEIIEYIQDNLGTELSGSVYIALMDHISFVKERAERGLLPKNSLTWEISRYYPEEFRLSRKVVELLEDELGISLNDDEAASISLHIINAENSLDRVQESLQSVKMVDDILQIICFQCGCDPDADSLSYQRLVTHVKFFVMRVLRSRAGKPLSRSDLPGIDARLAQMIETSYPRAHEIADRVREFAESTCGIRIADEEVSYLTINIERILRGGEKN